MHVTARNITLSHPFRRSSMKKIALSLLVAAFFASLIPVASAAPATTSGVAKVDAKVHAKKHVKKSVKKHMRVRKAKRS